MTDNHTDEYAKAFEETDTRERTIRTFFQGLALDVGIAVLLLLVISFSSIEWTATYWSVLGLSVAKTFLQATVSNLARKLIPPKANSL